MGPMAGLEGYGKSRPHRHSVPGPSSPQGVALPTELSQPTACFVKHFFFSEGIQKLVSRWTKGENDATVQTQILLQLYKRVHSGYCLPHPRH